MKHFALISSALILLLQGIIPIAQAEPISAKNFAAPVTSTLKLDTPKPGSSAIYSQRILLAEAGDAATTSDGFALPAQKQSMGDAPPPPANTMTPLERVNSTPIGQLKNPYADKVEEMAKWGQKRYMSNSCNGCHGGTGGGGMCPPISNDTWVYGSDDDTLFRLIALGSVELQKHLNTSRKGRENVVGPMPAFGEIIKTDDELWRIITFLRTTYRGDPARKNW